MSFSFGTPSSAPATSSLSGGFNFAAKPTTPGFGLGTSQTSTGLFGTPATSAPTFGNTSFGTTTPAFGAISTAPAFGSTTTPAFGANAGSLSFGATSTAPAFGGISAAPAFGATTTPAFGATTTPAFGTGTPAFGAGTGLGSSGLNFGTSTASSGLSFGTPATSAPTLGGLGGFGFGATTTTQTTGFGLFPSTATTTNSLFGNKLGTTNVSGTQALVTPSLGLGGVSTATGIATSTTSDGKTEPPKQTKLPNEILTNVDTFKEFVKKQKSLSTDIMRTSIKPLHKVSAEAEACSVVALRLGGEVSRARAASRRLRAAAAAALAAALQAADAAHGSDLEAEAPPAYIKELISELEQQLITFRRQMDAADKQMQSSPKLLTEQELTMGIRRMHESLVALAGRLQAVHSQVEAQKEQYLNLRKYILKDPTNVFETSASSNSLDQILRDAEGTRKKNKSLHDTSTGSAVLSDPKAALGNIHQLAGPTPFSYLGTSFSPFSSMEAAGASWQPQQQSNFNTSLNASGFGATSGVETSSFQLQKPPGKRTKQ